MVNARIWFRQHGGAAWVIKCVDFLRGTFVGSRLFGRIPGESRQTLFEGSPLWLLRNVASPEMGSWIPLPFKRRYDQNKAHTTKGLPPQVPLGKSSAPFIHSSELRHSRSLDFPQTQAAFLFFWVQYAAVELKHGGNCNLPPYCTAFSGSLRIWEGWNHLLIPRLVPY